MAPLAPPSLDGTIRRKPLSVVVREVLPPYPAMYERVGVLLDGQIAVPGKVIPPRLGIDTFRIALTEIDGSPLR